MARTSIMVIVRPISSKTSPSRSFLTFDSDSHYCPDSGISLRLPQEADEVDVSFIAMGIYYHAYKQFRWSPGKNPTNTVHAADIAGGLWACAGWMSPIGRSSANSIAGEDILFHNEKSKVKEVEGMPPHDKKLVAPLFNLVRHDLLSLPVVSAVYYLFSGG